MSPEWGWSWPANRRILYNRASADPQGRPWSERKRYVWWDEVKQRWTGYDVPDFPVDKPPDYEAPPDAEGPALGGWARAALYEGVGLDPEYARGTLTQVAALWGKPCTVRTVKGRDRDEPTWFTGHPTGRSEQYMRQPAG